MLIDKKLNAEKGMVMIEKILNQRKDELPDGKTIKHFGGGYVECLKTKAKVVLYFGFDENRNRVSLSFPIRQTQVLKWQEAIAEKLWNKEEVDDDIVEFEDEDSDEESEPTEDKPTGSPFGSKSK